MKIDIGAQPKKSNSETSGFKTPDQTAVEDRVSNQAKPTATENLHIKSQPSRWQSLLDKWSDLALWQKAALVVLLALILGGVAYGIYKATSSKPKAASSVVVQKPAAKPAPTPTTVPSNLTGLPVDPQVNNRPVTGVMIENSTFARPQSGLNQADIVFEAVAEGGITRFLALYHDNQPGSMGPIRSARPYYVQWALGFDATLAHVGGSPEALNDIKAWNVKDLDQFANGSYYQRIASRVAPHNVYTSIASLNGLQSAKGYNSSHFTSLPRKSEAPSKTPNASSIDFNMSGYLYNPHYDYIPATNSYKRSEAGAAFTDLVSGAQLEPKVVVGLVMQQGIEADDEHTSYNVLGNGKVYVFQDGTVTTGTWQKTGNADQITLTDDQSHPLKLNPGQTWFTAIASTGAVTYK